MKQHHKMEYPETQLKSALKKTAFVMDETPEGLAKDKALFDAFMKEDVEAVKQLLQSENGVRGANPNVKDEFGRTLYHLAKRWGWHQMRTVVHQYGGCIIHHSFSCNPLYKKPKPIQIVRSLDNKEHMMVLYQGQYIKE